MHRDRDEQASHRCRIGFGLVGSGRRAGGRRALFNVAIVGCGQIARAHLAALAAVPSARVVALCDRDQDRARELAPLAPGATSTASSATRCRDHHIDVVHVLTPPAQPRRHRHRGGRGRVPRPRREADGARRRRGRPHDRCGPGGRRRCSCRTTTTCSSRRSSGRARSSRRARSATSSLSTASTASPGSAAPTARPAGGRTGRGRCPVACSPTSCPTSPTSSCEFLGGPPRVVGAALGGDASDPTELVVQLAQERRARHDDGLDANQAVHEVRRDLRHARDRPRRPRAGGDLRPPGSAAAEHAGQGRPQRRAGDPGRRRRPCRRRSRVATGRLPRMPELRVLIARLYESLEAGTDTADDRRPGTRGRHACSRRCAPVCRSPSPPAPPPRLPTDAARPMSNVGPGRAAASTATSSSPARAGSSAADVAEALVRCGARPVLLARDPSPRRARAPRARADRAWRHP